MELVALVMGRKGKVDRVERLITMGVSLPATRDSSSLTVGY